MYYRNIRIIPMVIMVAIMAGCSSTPNHTNTLLFATSTKFAIDASVNPVSSATPELTIGYKRYEGVWMPLLVNQVKKNGIESATCISTNNQTPCLYQSSSTDYDKDGKPTKSFTDTYSVLASIGAKFEGDSSVNSNSQVAAKGGLAQFFATGLAAQNLSKTPDATKLLSIQPTDKIAFDEAQKRANAAEDIVRKTLGPEKVIAITQDSTQQIVDRQTQYNQIIKYLQNNGEIDLKKWQKLITESKLFENDQANYNIFTNLNERQIIAFLSAETRNLQSSTSNILPTLSQTAKNLSTE